MAVIDRITGLGKPITAAKFVDVRQSMRNGGGPACLRLRVVLTAKELSLLRPGTLLDDGIYDQLCVWVTRHYRESLSPDDLVDPELMKESMAAMQSLAGIFG